MDVESSLARRVRLHAALADPVRLAVVDALDCGDRSPSELAARLGLPSNLLAHHVGVLEDAGLVSRGRSQGDRRRTYLRLDTRQLETLLPASVERRTVPRVVFVCTANTARSQLADAVWRSSSEVPAASAGTRPADHVASGALAAAARHGITLAGASPRPVADVLQAGDLVVTVCDQAHEELPVPSDLHWSVPDPVRVGTDTAFEAAFAEITRRVERLAPHVHRPDVPAHHEETAPCPT